MKPILLVHGYSSEGRARSAADIYGSLPERLRARYGDAAVQEIDLARWVSLQDGISIDDVSLGLDRALHAPRYRALLRDGFHTITHSTGALVLRNWLRLYSARPSPLENLVHLAGAQFGSGLAHVGRGRLAKWGRYVLDGTGRGTRVLNELELGSNKTLDLHLYFRGEGNDLWTDYGVREFALMGSQTLQALRLAPIRFVKEDSSDNTVRVAASNPNFNHLRIVPTDRARRLSANRLTTLVNDRLDNVGGDEALYALGALDGLADDRRRTPFAMLFETAHTGEDIGILAGADNREAVEPRLFDALEADGEPDDLAAAFEATTAETFDRATTLDRPLDWDEQSQYEAHAMVVFRIRDQHGVDVGHHDITFFSGTDRAGRSELARLVEHEHVNHLNRGTTVLYLRLGDFTRRGGRRRFRNRLDALTEATVLEITGEEPGSPEIDYVPLTLTLDAATIRSIVQPLRTTVIDVTLVRLPSRRVFTITRSG